MYYSNLRTATQQYKDLGVASDIEHASPHRLIQLLLEGAMVRIARAKGHMQRKEIARKGECISQAISIVEALRASLDMDGGGEVAQQLEQLYEFSSYALLRANIQNDEAALDSVSVVIGKIKSAWDAIEPQVAETPQAQASQG